MNFSANKPVVVVDHEKLRQAGIDDGCLKRYLPEYILNPKPVNFGRMKRVGLRVLRFFLETLVKLFLSPRAKSGSLGREEVDAVYMREAQTYNRKHHITTRGMDLVWRRAAGWFAAVIARKQDGCLKLLDLCTGTGLTVQEVFAIAREWGVNLKVTALDFNEKMLAVARANTKVKEDRIDFFRGDAMDLQSSFKPSSFDLVTQVFGIGGIPEPIKVFGGILQVLRPGGCFIMIDMHKPIPQLPGEWPLLLKWCHFPTLEAFAYEEITLPLVLNRLWGWRDTTLCFYTLPLITSRDEEGKYWGFDVRSFEQGSERWWFALPLMPTAKIIVAKVELTEDEAKRRQTILASCTAR